MKLFHSLYIWEYSFWTSFYNLQKSDDPIKSQWLKEKLQWKNPKYLIPVFLFMGFPIIFHSLNYLS